MPLNARVSGNGMPVVLLHGFCEDLHIWDSIQTKLSPLHQVICLDLPGFGASPSLPSGFNIDDIAHSVAEQIIQITRGPVTVIGHSLGGYVALALADHHYELINGLGLFHSTSFSDSDEKRQNRDRTISFVLEHGTKPFIETFVPGLFFPEHLELHKDTISSLIEVGLRVDEAVIIDYTNAMKSRPDRSPVLYNLGKPRLFIAGDKDMAVPIKDSLTQISHLKSESTAVFEKTGHMGMFEQRKLSYTQIRNFLARI